ncbi:bifunctional 23S rRNA (guanine(2069)-N(7))-methyltransferase RlmK/23S rRNA (guanine(2445)-N(2))-methyltransferase RlmL [Acanthopleuribacter pedis]|uniref:Ribosomal RNA large subunit methyltransferase K/L n=1 Tax=Acanthopleuribacter pedis TaxID=442870 RepID=A0A8J7QD55_9BACT|nr:bifunctional 23S rRNA (guanine(2069)-N(7))-methyltransferase RlmK/23S rRNA (guanine(2445)-N(2))-methyltransferase RlmL [Acanthopleuribacter pedis]MBO1321604.1 bifunctional 23S rRNA (guanine(2069)-N(7))-methyltransferase RlmK/23S rRNA (guanine(2445)-N(2))-methyltransferase RlmL [Acanthopleuribacter pedis]
MHPYLAVVPMGMEDWLADELRGLGIDQPKPIKSRVAFHATPRQAARVLMESRLCGRLLFPLAEFEASDPNRLYEGVLTIPWPDHMQVDHAFMVEVNLGRSRITHAQFAAQRIKDAVCDCFRHRTGGRPSVDRDFPDIRIHCAIKNDRAVVSIDLGGSLHRRGYRVDGGLAPLKEHLAAAMLIRAGWPTIAAAGGALVDPMCGSGTLLIEGLMMAADIAPGLGRFTEMPTSWLGFPRGVWQEVVDEAKRRKEAGLARGLPPVFGFDRSTSALDAAKTNLQRAGLLDHVRLERRALAEWPDTRDVPFSECEPGLVMCNPPYGERLSELPELVLLYTMLGHQLKLQFPGWQAGLLTADTGLGKQTGLRAKRVNKMHNGPIACEFLFFDQLGGDESGRRAELLTLSSGRMLPIAESAAMFRNRLKKNVKHLRKWARRSGSPGRPVACYRVYDADLPEYNAALDVYGEHLLIQEYRAPSSVAKAKAERRLMDILLVAPEVLGIQRDKVVLKTRERKRGKDQYDKIDTSGRFLEVHERDLKFLVNLQDYLDTGLFLDHRPLRDRIRKLAEGKRFLNLFAYTGSATVYAAAGGAASSLTIDMSKTYLDWAQRNLELNKLYARQHRFEQTDCIQWLKGKHGPFDLIFLDPPSFSNSKRMTSTLDVQRDHVFLIERAGLQMAPDGLLIFSTNLRNFKIDREALDKKGYAVEDTSNSTIPEDFRRNQRIHQTYEIRRKP